MFQSKWKLIIANPSRMYIMIYLSFICLFISRFQFVWTALRMLDSSLQRPTPLCWHLTWLVAVCLDWSNDWTETILKMLPHYILYICMVGIQLWDDLPQIRQTNCQLCQDDIHYHLKYYPKEWKVNSSNKQCWLTNRQIEKDQASKNVMHQMHKDNSFALC